VSLRLRALFSCFNPFAAFAPLRALRETKKLSVFAPLCVKKMLQEFQLRGLLFAFPPIIKVQ